MSTSITLNGTGYTIPSVGEGSWGTSVSNYLVALSTGVLSKAGGSFTLTADADFGASFGLKSIYYKSRGTVSTSGIMRLANDEGIGWRNAANGANKILKVNSSDQLEFDGTPITPFASLTANRAMVTNGSGTPSAATTTATEIGYVNGVTSAIQTQLDAKIAASLVTTRGDLIRRGASGPERFAAVTNNRVVRGDGTDVVLGQIDSPSFFTSGANATSSAPGTINNYQENTYSIVDADLGTVSGGGTFSSTSGTLRATRVGKSVIITLDNFTTTTASSVNGIVLQSGAILPANFRPASPMQLGTFNVGIGGTGVFWRMLVGTDGIITISTRDNTNANTTISNATYSIGFTGSYTL